MSRVRVLIVEDHRVVAEGLQALLEDDPGIEVCQIAGSVAEAVGVASAATSPNTRRMSGPLVGTFRFISSSPLPLTAATCVVLRWRSTPM